MYVTVDGIKVGVTVDGIIIMGTVTERSRDGTVMRALASTQCGRGSIPRLGIICGLFVVGSRPSSERFFSGYSGLSPLHKNQYFQFPI